MTSHEVGVCGQKLQGIVQGFALGVYRDVVQCALVKFGRLLARDCEAGAILRCRVRGDGELKWVW